MIYSGDGVRLTSKEKNLLRIERDIPFAWNQLVFLQGIVRHSYEHSIAADFDNFDKTRRDIGDMSAAFAEVDGNTPRSYDLGQMIVALDQLSTVI